MVKTIEPQSVRITTLIVRFKLSKEINLNKCDYLIQTPGIGFCDIDNDGHKDGKCSLKGPLGTIFNGVAIEPWLRAGNKYVDDFS